MNIIQIAWKYIQQNKANSILGILLATFGTAILCILMLTAEQLENQLENNSRGIDLVVGAKGSPTQLILSSVFHMDNPTGNISYDEAIKLRSNPFVKNAIPLSLGDNFKGHRIVGTEKEFIDLYELSLKEGKIWENDFEAVIGYEVAQTKGLKVGDKFYGAHGLSEDGHHHGDHPYIVTGILESSGRVPDRLILTNLESVWEVHGLHDDHDHDHEHGTHEGHDHDHEHDHASHEEHSHDHDHDHDHASHEGHNHEHENQEEEVVLLDEKPREDVFVKSIATGFESQGLEITAVLIEYSNPAAIGVLPRTINQNTEMQAASPALESARLFSLLGIGIDSLEILAYVIMFMAAFSVFISLYNAFKSRKYDLAVMRTLGASKFKLFTMVISEGILITFLGAIFGLLLGHIAIYLIGQNAGNAGSLISAMAISPNEWYLLIVGLIIGFVASIIPAIKAYNTPISQTLSGN